MSLDKLWKTAEMLLQSGDDGELGHVHIEPLGIEHQQSAMVGVSPTQHVPAVPANIFSNAMNLVVIQCLDQACLSDVSAE